MMRKTFTLLMLVGFVLSLAVPALAARKQIEFKIGQKTYTVDGAAYTADVAPLIKNNRTYVPVRYLAYALGVPENNVTWDPETCIVELVLPAAESDLGRDERVELEIGSHIIWSQRLGYVSMDVTPFIQNGRTYLPARFVAEAFGYEVGWCHRNRTVAVGPPGQVEHGGHGNEDPIGGDGGPAGEVVIPIDDGGGPSTTPVTVWP
jgi:hypothetical protein